MKPSTVSTAVAFWRRTPPAVFSPLLGLFGLGLAWRNAVPAYLVDPGIGEAVLGAVTLFYGFALLAYGAKLLRRPAVLIEDLRVLPGRAGVSAITISAMLLAAVLVPYAQAAATALLFLSLAAHLGVALLILRQVLTSPAEQRVVTPVWHLHFVGFIVGAVAAVPLGYATLADGLFYATLPIGILIWAVSAAQFVRTVPTAPLRPLLAIHLAPASLYATIAALLGHEELALGFALLAVAIFVVLIAASVWLCRGGFSPLWGAFTFPIAAFAVAMMVQATPPRLEAMMGFGTVAPFWRLFGALALTVATLTIPLIAARVFQGWAKGTLAARTNAATA